jgi:hypothetical protein
MATEPLSVQAFTDVQATLDAAPNRDVITETLLEFLGQGFERVILFIHLRGQLRGRDARGSDLMVDAVTRVRIPTGAGSLFADVANSGVPYWGAWPLSRPTDKAFAQAMGGIGGRALLLPVRLRDKIPLIVFASGTSVEVTLDAFKKLGEATSTALERILFKKKSSQTNIETP